MQKKYLHKTLRYAALISLGFAIVGCHKLRETGDAPQVPAIPAALGDFVGVTPDEIPYQSVLWFKQPDQTIVAVRVNVAKGTIYAKTIKFPRS